MTWQRSAACAGHPDPDLWFATRGGSYNQARRICDRCPVTIECLGAAFTEEVAERERFGMRGGYTPQERDYLAGTGKTRLRDMGRTSLLKIGRHADALDDYFAAVSVEVTR